MLIILPIVGAFIGWMTNKIAITLIFRPYKPIKIPAVNYSIQGLLPKRRQKLASDLGGMVEKELLPMDDILDKIKEPAFQEKLFVSLTASLYDKIISRMPISLPSYMKNMLFKQIEETVEKEAPAILDSFLLTAKNDLEEQFTISEMVSKKVDDFDLEKLEKLVVKIVNKELKHIEYLGAVIGFAIGLVQWVLVVMMPA
ncbi:uncharacterized membrane protein YheB (UPF0754 family) [Desulfitispora alkaliphila]|uniref:DUF445 domain-containing protein n=1 Tax=Desulfitispora alkaliphila TaxID=622674 RepID=UPI003D1A1077